MAESSNVKQEEQPPYDYVDDDKPFQPLPDPAVFESWVKNRLDGISVRRDRFRGLFLRELPKRVGVLDKSLFLKDETLRFTKQGSTKLGTLRKRMDRKAGIVSVWRGAKGVREVARRMGTLDLFNLAHEFMNRCDCLIPDREKLAELLVRMEVNHEAVSVQLLNVLDECKQVFGLHLDYI
ncbi:hypothetical protein MLD38_020366 [Melastoma candidum]|uniref:Uncharacterized protein n=1 Tax=Melastoma candidum TaxID=119954 RepID=A0ACB9QC58_9MYRT|nr:hypothetical protein MLD38_020366 [Melastoma candidum]